LILRLYNKTKTYFLSAAKGASSE